MNQHRSDNKDPQFIVLYNHFNQLDHDPSLSMKVRIIEKIYHHTNSPVLRTPFQKETENLDKATRYCISYGCNDNVKGVGNLSSPSYSDVNEFCLIKPYENNVIIGKNITIGHQPNFKM